MSRGLSTDQAKTAAAIREKMEESGVSTPLALPRTELALAHRAGYENLANADDKTVSSYVSHNLSSPVFLAALGFDCNEMRQLVGDHIVNNLAGENPKFKGDKDLYLN